MFEAKGKQSLGPLTGHKLLIVAAIIVGQSIPLMACDPGDRAADENVEEVGWQERGRNPGSYAVQKPEHPTEDPQWVYTLEYSDVILTPDGTAVLAMAPAPGPDKGWASPGLVLTILPMNGGPKTVLPGEKDLRRINFSPDGKLAYLLRKSGSEVAVLDLASRSIIDVYSLSGTWSVLDVSPDGGAIVFSNLPTTDLEEAVFGTECMSSLGKHGPANRCAVESLELATGLTRYHTLNMPLRDLDFSPIYPGEAVLTMSTWLPGSDVPLGQAIFWNAYTGEVSGKASFPNCADELKIQPGGHLGLMAPTRCQRDPITVLDLKARTFVKNLPGFGPVSISRSGDVAIGFTRKQSMQDEWGVAQKEPVGIIVVDLHTLDWTVVEYGQWEPTYLVDPAGDNVYLYSDGTHCETELTRRGPNRTRLSVTCEDVSPALQRLDLATLTYHPVAGPDMRLRHYVSTPDDQRLIEVNNGALVQLDYETRMVTTLPYPAPLGTDLINIRPQGDAVVLSYSYQPVFHVVPLSGAASLTVEPTLGAP